MDQGVDVVALGNMCVDILPPPAPIPKPETLKTEAMLAELTAASPNQASWEVGGKDLGLGFFSATRHLCHAHFLAAFTHSSFLPVASSQPLRTRWSENWLSQQGGGS